MKRNEKEYQALIKFMRARKQFWSEKVSPEIAEKQAEWETIYMAERLDGRKIKQRSEISPIEEYFKSGLSDISHLFMALPKG